RGASRNHERSIGSPQPSSAAWIRGALVTDSPPGRIASATSLTGASRTSSQVSNRSRSRPYAVSRLVSLVFWERIVLTSSCTGSPCGWFTGRPYIRRSRSRIARTRRFSGGFQVIAAQPWQRQGWSGAWRRPCAWHRSCGHLQSRNTFVRRFVHPIAQLVRALGARLPRGWGDLLRQFAFFFVAYWGYQLVRGIADGRDAVALANGVHVMQLERSLGAFF